MAWRIHDHVVRGEIDNREKGIVRGRLWLAGVAQPARLELAGNAGPDLAGCLLKFKNPAQKIALPKKPRFAALQKGKIGELTASRKVRVFTVPLAEARARSRRGEKPPERRANLLYLEWFSEANGRVVVESADYELNISAPEWRLTPAEEQQRRLDAEAGWDMFAQQLNDAIQQQQCGQKDPETEEWDEHDYEKFLKESDARTAKYMELHEKYGDSDEAEEKIAQEMGWARERTPEEAEAESQWIEEANRASEEALNEPEPEPDPAREGIDWIRTKNGDLRHPLQHRCYECAMKYWNLADELGPISDDGDLTQFISEFQITSAKLAGALNSIARDRGVRDAAFTVAYLKRALDHLHKAQAGLEAATPKKLLPPETVAAARHDLFAIREGILNLMDEYRGRK